MQIWLDELSDLVASNDLESTSNEVSPPVAANPNQGQSTAKLGKQTQDNRPEQLESPRDSSAPQSVPDAWVDKHCEIQKRYTGISG